MTKKKPKAKARPRPKKKVPQVRMKTVVKGLELSIEECLTPVGAIQPQPPRPQSPFDSDDETVKSLRAGVEALNRQVNEKAAELEAMTKDAKDARSQMAILDNALACAEQNICKLRTEHTDLQNSYDLLTERSRGTGGLVPSGDDQIARHKDEISRLAENNKVLHEAYGKVKSELDDANRGVHRLEGILVEKESIVEMLEQQLKKIACGNFGIARRDTGEIVLINAPEFSDFLACQATKKMSLYEAACQIQNPEVMNKATEAIGKTNTERNAVVVAKLKDRVIEILKTQKEENANGI